MLHNKTFTLNFERKLKESEGKTKRSSKVATKEAAIGSVLYKKLFLEILQYSQENNCYGVSF